MTNHPSPALDPSNLTTNDFTVVTAAIQAKLESIISLSETFNKHQDAIGIVACAIVLYPTYTNLEHLVGPSDQGPVKTGDVHKDAAIEKAHAKIGRILERADHIALREKREDTPPPNPKNVGLAELAATAVSALSDAHAISAMVGMTANAGLDEDIRWTALGFAQGLAAQEDLPHDITDTLHQRAWESLAGTGHTIRDQITLFNSNDLGWKAPITQAALDLYRQHGIDQASNLMLARPGVIHDAIQSMDPQKACQFTTDLAPHNEAAADGVILRHRETTHIKTILEPFPPGFPATTAADIAQQYIDRCIRSTQDHPGLPRQQMLQDGISALRLAQTHLHTAQPDDIVNLVDNITDMLPQETDLVRYVMTVLTGRDHRVHQALLQHHLELVPTITGNRATRLIRAARRAGLQPTELWELARTLSIDPRDHSIQRPTLDQDILEDVAQAAIRAGIPESMVAILRAETALDVTGDHTP